MDEKLLYISKRVKVYAANIEKALKLKRYDHAYIMATNLHETIDRLIMTLDHRILKG